ncbi:MAG: ImmA/IrrE family metallo-endopeptidase [Actinobacteria bacterium]|nr:ImmA/IrrE family metallo-endopeptidase [Actinomycetota bacterium]
MKRVIDKANQLNETFGNDLDRITDSLGLSVMYEEMNGRMKEFYFRGAIVVRADLSTREKRELIAHALGHHLFHAGNHLAMQKRIYSFGNYHEKQANAFAACLLIPLSKLSRLMADRARIDEMADHFQVREEVVRLRLMIWANFEKDLSGSSARVG